MNRRNHSKHLLKNNISFILNFDRILDRADSKLKPIKIIKLF